MIQLDLWDWQNNKIFYLLLRIDYGRVKEHLASLENDDGPLP